MAPKTDVARQRQRIEKLKKEGKYEEFKRRWAEQWRMLRKKSKENMTPKQRGSTSYGESLSKGPFGRRKAYKLQSHHARVLEQGSPLTSRKWHHTLLAARLCWMIQVIIQNFSSSHEK